jgi:transcriptional regulator with XRE-family HTH domain
VGTTTILQSLGDEIRERREQRHLTQEALAHAAGMHTNAIGRLERGETDSKVLTLFKVAMGLNTPLAELIAGAVTRSIAVARSSVTIISTL